MRHLKDIGTSEQKTPSGGIVGIPRRGEDGCDDFQRLLQVAGADTDAVMITDASGLIEYVNPAFEAMTGYSSEEVAGRSAGVVKSGLHGASFYAGMWASLQAGRRFRALFANRRKNGEIFHEEKAIRPFVDAQGVVRHFVSSGRDVSERIRTLLNLEHQAYYDSLTGLPNRQLFMDRLGRSIIQASRREGNFTLLFMDLDEFKAINDTFGHAVGDDMLRTAALRLRQCVRDEDTVARLGGDEFAVILAGITRHEDIERVSGKIRDALFQGACFGNRHINIRASIGACRYPFDGESEAHLLRNADMAMYLRKTSGGNGCSFFDRKRAWIADFGQQALPLAGQAGMFGRVP